MLLNSRNTTARAAMTTAPISTVRLPPEAGGSSSSSVRRTWPFSTVRTGTVTVWLLTVRMGRVGSSVSSGRRSDRSNFISTSGFLRNASKSAIMASAD